MGAERIALGSDYPFPLGEPVPGSLIESMGLAPAVARLLHGSAIEWLGRARIPKPEGVARVDRLVLSRGTSLPRCGRRRRRHCHPARLRRAAARALRRGPARAEPMRRGGFTGDTHLGGSCNARVYTLNAHCNGTHTECVSH